MGLITRQFRLGTRNTSTFNSNRAYRFKSSSAYRFNSNSTSTFNSSSTTSTPFDFVSLIRNPSPSLLIWGETCRVSKFRPKVETVVLSSSALTYVDKDSFGFEDLARRPRGRLLPEIGGERRIGKFNVLDKNVKSLLQLSFFFNQKLKISWQQMIYNHS